MMLLLRLLVVDDQLEAVVNLTQDIGESRIGILHLAKIVSCLHRVPPIEDGTSRSAHSLILEVDWS